MNTAPPAHDRKPGPYANCAEAEARYGTRTAAEAAHHLADALGAFGVDLGQYEKDLISRIAAADPVDALVIASWVFRLMWDVPDTTTRKDTDH
jgi:hypothetical protein